MERLLQISVDESINIGSSIISELGPRRADTYRDVFEILKSEGMIDDRVSEKLVRLVGMRNKLVHRYWKVEEDEIRQALEELQVFRNFVKGVLKVLEKQGRPGP